MKIRTRGRIPALLVALLMLAAACGGTTDETTDTSVEEPTSDTTVMPLLLKAYGSDPDLATTEATASTVTEARFAQRGAE